MVILTGLSVMDYKIRKVPRDVLLLCAAGAVVNQVVTQCVDWRLSIAGGMTGIIFLEISRIDRIAGNFFFYAWSDRSGSNCSKTNKERSCVSILSISDSRISVRCLLWRTLR